MTQAEAIHQTSVDMHMETIRLDVLMQSILAQLDEVQEAAPCIPDDMLAALNAINCFATCAMRSSSLMREMVEVMQVDASTT